MKSIILLLCVLVALGCSGVQVQLPPCYGTEGVQQVPDPTDCAHFYVCIDGQGFRMQCGPGLIFDVVTGNCNREADSVCIKEVATPPTPQV